MQIEVLLYIQLKQNDILISMHWSFVSYFYFGSKDGLRKKVGGALCIGP